MDLSKKQQEIVDTEDESICVKACAGSGKTRVLTERIKTLLHKTKKKILALTFTNKAAEEMRDRLQDISNVNHRVFIGTFHGLGREILENYGHLIGFSKMPHIFENRYDLQTLMKQAIFLTFDNSECNGNLDKISSKALEKISKVKRENGPLEEMLFKNYQGLLREQNAIDFDDLLDLAYQILTEYPSVASLYKRIYYAIFVDEAQDLNYIQYNLLFTLTGGRHNIMLVGDPGQSIFRFAGASPKYMDFFTRDFNARVMELNENHRSSKKTLEATKKIFPNSPHVDNAVRKGLFEIEACQDEKEESLWIIEKIRNLYARKKHSDIEGEITYEKNSDSCQKQIYLFFPGKRIE